MGHKDDSYLTNLLSFQLFSPRGVNIEPNDVKIQLWPALIGDVTC